MSRWWMFGGVMGGSDNKSNGKLLSARKWRNESSRILEMKNHKMSWWCGIWTKTGKNNRKRDEISQQWCNHVGVVSSAFAVYRHEGPSTDGLASSVVTHRVCIDSMLSVERTNERLTIKHRNQCMCRLINKTPTIKCQCEDMTSRRGKLIFRFDFSEPGLFALCRRYFRAKHNHHP